MPLCQLKTTTSRQFDHLAPIADLLLRLYIAKVFFSSGLTKISDWSTTIALFSDEYHVPLLPPQLAAVFGTTGELLLPVLLLLGIATRLSALGLFFLNLMAVISYFHILKEIPAALQDHLEWGLMILMIIGLPAGRLTIDYLLPCGKKNTAAPDLERK